MRANGLGIIGAASFAVSSQYFTSEAWRERGDANVRAYDAAKARLEEGEDELVPLALIERRLNGEAALRIWREYRKLTQEQPAKKAKVSRALIAAIETKRKSGSVSKWKRLGAALGVGLEQLG